MGPSRFFRFFCAVDQQQGASLWLEICILPKFVGASSVLHTTVAENSRLPYSEQVSTEVNMMHINVLTAVAIGGLGGFLLLSIASMADHDPDEPGAFSLIWQSLKGFHQRQARASRAVLILGGLNIALEIAGLWLGSGVTTGTAIGLQFCTIVIGHRLFLTDGPLTGDERTPITSIFLRVFAYFLLSLLFFIVTLGVYWVAFQTTQNLALSVGLATVTGVLLTLPLAAACLIFPAAILGDLSWLVTAWKRSTPVKYSLTGALWIVGLISLALGIALYQVFQDWRDTILTIPLVVMHALISIGCVSQAYLYSTQLRQTNTGRDKAR